MQFYLAERGSPALNHPPSSFGEHRVAAAAWKRPRFKATLANFALISDSSEVE